MSKYLEQSELIALMSSLSIDEIKRLLRTIGINGVLIITKQTPKLEAKGGYGIDYSDGVYKCIKYPF